MDLKREKERHHFTIAWSKREGLAVELSVKERRLRHLTTASIMFGRLKREKSVQKIEVSEERVKIMIPKLKGTATGIVVRHTMHKLTCRKNTFHGEKRNHQLMYKIIDAEPLFVSRQ